MRYVEELNLTYKDNEEVKDFSNNKRAEDGIISKVAVVSSFRLCYNFLYNK